MKGLESNQRGNPEALDKSQGLIYNAKIASIERSSKTPEAVRRIESAIERRFSPYVVENEEIADEISSEAYIKFTRKIKDFLDARVGFVACPDGRIIAISLGDPRVASVHRKLQGLPEVRRSTSVQDKFVLDDPDLAASIESGIEDKKESKPDSDVEVVEFVGPHIHSQHPDNGCGACAAKMQAKGHAVELGMRLGGITEYFGELNDGFFAFDNVAFANGAIGNTFDLTHDAYTQGFIIGLRDAYKEFDRNLSLRENLNKLSSERKILAVDEQLANSFRQTIKDRAKHLGVESNLNMRDYIDFAQKLIIIGQISKELTIEEEEKGLRWIPEHIIKDKTERAKRVLAYHSLRNVVYRVLGGIEPGSHALTEHPEQLIRIGPIGADFNVQNIPFIQSMPRGRIRPEDMDGVRGLYNLSYGVLKHQGVDLTTEGRIILVTGTYDQKRFGSTKVAKEEFNAVKSMVLNNAAWIRLNYEDSIATGETIVIGAIHEQGTRKLTHVF